MSVKNSQAVLKCFTDLKSSVWFTLSSEDETMFWGTLETFFSSTAGQGVENTKWAADPFILRKFHKSKESS